MLNSPISEIINALGLPKVSTYGLIINSVIMIASIVIGAQWGIVGVCIAWIFGYTTSFFIFNTMASKYTTVSVFDIVKSIFPAFINSVIMIVSLKLLFSHYLLEESFFNLLLGIVVGVSIYTLLTFINNRAICIDMYRIVRK
jgi:O-antigen/teichoic acid export membrane protein